MIGQMNKPETKLRGQRDVLDDLFSIIREITGYRLQINHSSYFVSKLKEKDT